MKYNKIQFKRGKETKKYEKGIIDLPEDNTHTVCIRIIDNDNIRNIFVQQ